MLINVLTREGYQDFNIALARVIGLKEAIYMKVLLDIRGKAEVKKRVNKNFIVVDRAYIEKRTTIKPEQQLNIDKTLANLGLVTLSESDADSLEVNVQLYATLLGCENLEKAIKDIKSIKSRSSKESKNAAITRNLKALITVDNIELKTAYDTWIETITEKFGYMSKEAVKDFEKQVNEFAKGDLDVALDLLRIGSINAYRDCGYCIQIYLRNKNIREVKPNVRTTEQKRASIDTISNEVF